VYHQGVSFKHRKRIFLAPASTGLTSYILAEVESTHNGEYKWGTNMLTIADCRRRIQLEFLLGTPKARRQSLAKINLLITTLVRFGHALKTEAELIEQFEKAAKKKPSKKRKSKKNAS
jgi:hypothetical protein